MLENTDHLTIKQAEVSELIVEDGVLKGVKTVSGAAYYCKAAVLCTGVYLNARCIYGDVSMYTGPNGLQAATHLTDSLRKNGVEMMRFKTGTPARVDKRSIDFSKMEEQKGDELDCDGNFTVEIRDGVTNLECSCVFDSSYFWYWANCVEAIKGKRLAELILNYFGDDYFELVSYKVKED